MFVNTELALIHQTTENCIYVKNLTRYVSYERSEKNEDYSSDSRDSSHNACIIRYAGRGYEKDKDQE
jgi:hypothetical protein